MMRRLLQERQPDRLLIWSMVAGIILGAAVLGRYSSFYPSYVSALLVLCLGVIVLLLRPIMGLLALVPAALVVRFEFGTGTAVAINPSTLLLPTLLGIWVLDMMRQRQVCMVASRTNRPLFLFLLAGLLSLLIGLAIWDPSIPREADFLVVQLAQWAIFAFSAGAFWLSGNLVQDETWLRRLTWLFLALAGGLAILRVMPFTTGFAGSFATFALERAPFWMLLAALAGGQLLFNRALSVAQRLFLLATLGAASAYVFLVQRQTASNWVGVVAVLGVLAWLRWPRLRWPVVIVLVVLVTSGLLTSAVYEFAGGDVEWLESGGSRVALINRTVRVTMLNPVTGLGPAAYRLYTKEEPLQYRDIVWFDPQVSSHNNYVDLFSHGGLLGLGLLLWFVIELGSLGVRLRSNFTEGFAAGYVNGTLAAGAGALVLMLFADWILPFVYNIGFPGFQASILVWLFLGGLVSLEHIAGQEQSG